jgi:hypothetical protein
MSYFPAKEAEFVSWSANLIAGSKKYAAELDLPADQLAALEALQDEFALLHEKCRTAARSKVDTLAKNEAKAALIKKEEVFVRNHLQNNDRMTDPIRAELGIPVYDTKPTPLPAPESVPEAEVLTPHPRTVRIRFRGENAPRWGKPAGVHGIECLWAVAEAPVIRIADLSHSSFATRNPLDLVFEEDQRGKRVYFAVRWESGTVKKGPWSEIQSAVIP